MPLLSILIPVKGRPRYAENTVFSVMHQDFDDFDVTYSNNGAEPAVKAAVAEFMADSRFHYVEQPSVLDMPSHWDLASSAVAGDYLLILTDRSVLKQGVLKKLSRLLRSGSGDVEVVSWGWEIYNNTSGLLSPCLSSTGNMLRLKTLEVLLRFARGSISMMDPINTLPLGLNSCVSRSLVERIRGREGHAFQSINPDYRFAFSCLLNADELVHFDEAFFVSQGSEVSNGINAIRGDFRPYINSLGLAEPWEDVPIKAALVFNSMAQDFLAAVRKYGRSDIRAQWNRPKYYMDCLMELRMKRNAGILTNSEISELAKAVELALQNEDESIRVSVGAPFTRRVLNKIKSLARIVVEAGGDVLRPRRHRSGGDKTFRTALEAAGFEH